MSEGEEAASLLPKKITEPKSWTSGQRVSMCCVCSCGTVVIGVVVAALICLAGYQNNTQCGPAIEANGGDAYVAWWNMPELQSSTFETQTKLQARFQPLSEENNTYLEEQLPAVLKGRSSWGQASAAEMAELMFEGTKLQGVRDDVPSKLRGVFWMRGNSIAEELTVLQYGRWFEDAKTLVVPMAPYMWAWPAGKPVEVPGGGILYGFAAAVLAGVTLLKPLPISLSFLFSKCPDGSEYCNPSSSDPMAYANMQVHASGNMAVSGNIGDAARGLIVAVLPFLNIPADTLTGAFTLQEMDSAKPDSLYKRTCHWGLGECTCIEFGSYNLTKILDENGEKIQPYYTDWINYMGDVKVYTWNGFKSKEAMRAAAKDSEAEAKGSAGEL